eukprot:907849_1
MDLIQRPPPIKIEWTNDNTDNGQIVSALLNVPRLTASHMPPPIAAIENDLAEGVIQSTDVTHGLPNLDQFDEIEDIDGTIFDDSQSHPTPSEPPSTRCTTDDSHAPSTRSTIRRLDKAETDGDQEPSAAADPTEFEPTQEEIDVMEWNEDRRLYEDRGFLYGKFMFHMNIAHTLMVDNR